VIAKTSNGIRHAAVSTRFTSLLTTHSALFTPSPPSGPAQRLLQEPPAKSKFLAVQNISPNTAMKKDKMEHQSACLELLEPHNLPSVAGGTIPSWWRLLGKTTARLFPVRSHFSQKMTVGLAGAILMAGFISNRAPAQPTVTSGSRITGFEPLEGYSLGDLNNQNGWKVDRGSAEVWSNQVFSGIQAARIDPGGQVSNQFATASPIVTYDSYLQAAPSAAPEIPTTAQLAVLYLDQSGGITGLNGDGNGGGGWVSSGVAITPGNWFRVTIRLDFTARTWSCAVNGIATLSNLRFHSDHVVAFSTLSVGGQATGDTLLDQVTVSTENPPLSLAIRRNGDAVELSWPLSASGYRLQTSTTLSPGTWQDVTTLDNHLMQPIDQPSKFFRLIGP
jgi:hypothetical protein